MLRIQRQRTGRCVFQAERSHWMRKTLANCNRYSNGTEGRQIILDLKDLTLVDREAVRFLERCEADSIKLKNCPAYIREWIERERNACDLH